MCLGEHSDQKRRQAELAPPAKKQAPQSLMPGSRSPRSPPASPPERGRWQAVDKVPARPHAAVASAPGFFAG